MSGQDRRQPEPDGADGKDARPLGDIFTGKMPLREALQRLRTRLLDLSPRNRLLNYRHARGRSLQFVDEPNLNLVFDRLIEGKSIQTRYVPEPQTDSYEKKRPEAAVHARSLGINVDPQFPPSACVDSGSKHAPKVQTLYYPADLEKLCRKMSSQAHSVIEETGTNMLYLVFGFLEFYESEDSEKPMLAPLLAVPVALDRGEVDPETRTYQYSVTYSGEDIHENQTLREKLSQDFGLQLPELGDEGGPGSYLGDVQHAVRRRKRWRVRHQLTLGFLSFAKLAIWDDLDPKKWPGLLTHPLLKTVFAGGSGRGATLLAEDYEIDKHPRGDLQLVYDADSSQHSAIIDVLDGKNRVINGPPGTGKSQTITNVIAAALRSGKTVLFVSDKLAALEVVRHRLDRAGLGHFCLELHSHKTQKKKLLEDLQARLDKRFRAPRQFQDKLATLNKRKQVLNRYAELMASRIGNKLDLTVHQVFWAVERRRQVVGDLADATDSLFLPEAPEWTYDEIEFRRTKLEALGQLYAAVGSFDPTHPWWGFTPKQLAPGDDEAIGRIVGEALTHAEALARAVAEFQAKTGDRAEPDLASLERLNDALQGLPEPPAALNGPLLSRVYTEEDPLGKRSRELLAGVVHSVERARELNRVADGLVAPSCDLGYEDVEPVMADCCVHLARSVPSTRLSVLTEWTGAARRSLIRFQGAASNANWAFRPVRATALERLREKLGAVAPLTLLSQSPRAIRDGAIALRRESLRLRRALDTVSGIAARRSIDFDGSPAAVARVGGPDGFPELVPGAEIDESVVAKAQQAAAHFLADLSIADLREYHEALHALEEKIDLLLAEVDAHVQQLGLPLDSSHEALSCLAALTRIAARAPLDLLDHRRPSLGRASTGDLLVAAEEAHAAERTQREQLAGDFYLDAVPDAEVLRGAIRVFRRGDRPLNVLNREWRSANRIFRGMAREKSKRKAADCEAHACRIVAWLEHRDSFVANREYQETFGPLFKGLDTDFAKIRRLHAWYVESQDELSKHPRFLSAVDLSVLEFRKIQQLAALAPRVEALTSELEECAAAANQILGPMRARFDAVRLHAGWADYNKRVSDTAADAAEITTLLERYVLPNVSPKRAAQLLAARIEVVAAGAEFDALQFGVDELHRSIEPSLPGLATIACRRWGEYLAKVSGLAEAANSLAEACSEFGGDEATVSDLEGFLEAKVELDGSLRDLARSAEREAAHDWHSYAAAAARCVEAGERLVQLLTPVAEGERTPDAVVGGLAARRDAADLMSSAAADPRVGALLQGFFLGVQTDIEALADTLAWGASVLSDRVIRESPLASLLRSPEAAANYEWAALQLDEITRLHEATMGKMRELEAFGALDWQAWNATGQGTPANVAASTLAERTRAAYDSLGAVLPWSKYHAERSDCENSGLGDLVLALEQKAIPPADIGPALEFAIYRSIGRGIYRSCPELERFAGAKHERTRAEYAALDREIIGLTGKSFAYEIDRAKKVPNGSTGYRAADRTEMHLLAHELSKQTRHIPIRQLIKRAGRAIQALKPCFMMGPMSVAQYLEQGAVGFDLVVMDEASQLRPEEAIGVIARGKQLVVVGDPKQLPPTSFFDRMLDGGGDDEDEDAPAALVGSESILDICQQLLHPVRTLRWHYRSQHESLIAFSNHHFYDGRLLVFPSPFAKGGRLGVRYRHVANGVYESRQNVPEAARVVEAVAEHVVKHPDESLGVVTLNQTQRELVEDMLDRRLRNDPRAQRYISKWEKDGWPLFVKNLENVQGDERDVIFISTTFGRPQGVQRVRQNFGPISRPDGWRRLNVLFTRARRRVELFTSMLPGDVLVDATTPAGTKALSNYLDYAKRGVLATVGADGREPESDFEVSVSDMLRSRGYEVVPQLGVAGFFIDLAIRNPERPGEFLAAIECDGASYHSSGSARDRDRIRQEILESLGWKDRIWRIWSTDWFYDPRRESARLLAFLEERQRIATLFPAPEEDPSEELTSQGKSDEAAAAAASEGDSDPTLSAPREELFVEVGDTVMYCFTERPDERLRATITDSTSDPERGLVNERAPLAQALLNAAVGDQVEMRVDGRPDRTVRVLRIQHQSGQPT